MNPVNPVRARRPVALVEWNTGGHHDAYLVLFTAALLRAGHVVIVLCLESAELKKGLKSSVEVDPVGERSLRIEQIPGPEWLAERRRWPFGLAYGAYAERIKSALVKAEHALGAGEAELYFTCLYEHQVRMVDAVLGRLQGRVWSGLYLHAHAYHRPDVRAAGVKKAWPITRLWVRRGFRGLLMLDEGIAAEVERAVGRPVRVVPDLADASCREGEPLVAEALRHAAGRPVVGLLGHLLPSKGVATLARCALENDSTDLAFLFAGVLHRAMFEPAEIALLSRLMEGEKQNAWFHDGRIPDEASYNALVRCCAVLCAAYRDFPHSSNTLAKAAIFEKPIIVSEGHLMARRVREFRLGEVVPQDDVGALLAALRRVLADPAGWAAAMRPRWREYRELHSRERLANVLGEFFGET